jgi:hypothetical protein
MLHRGRLGSKRPWRSTAPAPIPVRGNNLARRVDRLERAGGHCLAAIRLASVARRLLSGRSRFGSILAHKPTKNPLFASFLGRFSDGLLANLPTRRDNASSARKSLRRRPPGGGRMRMIATRSVFNKMQPHPTGERGVGLRERRGLCSPALVAYSLRGLRPVFRLSL